MYLKKKRNYLNCLSYFRLLSDCSGDLGDGTAIFGRRKYLNY